jgi:3-mercaptopropionate dioxygenase
MCDFHTDLPPLDADEYRLDTPRVRGFVADVRERLANDTGCVWRHTYDERTGETSPFRSGYVNAECVAD